MGERRLLSIASQEQLRQMLRYMLDEREFLSPYGIRALSQIHRDQPYHLSVNGMDHRVDYEPAESSTGLRRQLQLARSSLVSGEFRADRIFAEVSLLSWRQFQSGMSHRVRQYDDALRGSRRNLRRLMNIFLQGADGRRPVFGGTEKFQNDPHWRNLIPFHEYFHGDNGAGIGASHQTGWTGLVAKLIQQYQG